MNICGEKGARNGSFLLISYTNTNEQHFIFIFFGNRTYCKCRNYRKLELRRVNVNYFCSKISFFVFKNLISEKEG